MIAIEIFRENRTEIIRLWTEAVFNTYPLETTGFLRTKQDPFGNPVASMTREATGALYDAVAGEEIYQPTLKAALERFVKLRAVQKFTPSQALGVLYLLKPIMREKLMRKMMDIGQTDAYLEAESRLDSLVLLAFDQYTQARETVAELRITEIRNQYAQIKRWAQKLDAQSPLATDAL